MAYIIQDTIQNTSEVSIKIFDILGSVITEFENEMFNQGSHLATIPLDLDNGQYFIRIEKDGNLLGTQKFVVIN